MNLRFHGTNIPGREFQFGVLDVEAPEHGIVPNFPGDYQKAFDEAPSDTLRR